jgi:hypothetical protein
MLFYIVEIVPLKELHDFRKSITVHHFGTIISFAMSRSPYNFPV